MKLKPYIWIAGLTITTVGVVLPGNSQQITPANTLFQTSTISALAAGVYDGDTNFQELKKHGDFGLGTVNALDGEMIGLDGKFYQIKSNGVTSLIPDQMKSPFAVVTFFKPQTTIRLPGQMTYQQMQQSLDQKITTKNYPYALRIQGNFPYLKVRSVPKQKPPYPPLVNAVKAQTIFELKNVNGTLVGFRLPAYMSGVNVSGYHFHFITKDKKTGGHLLDGQLQNLQIEISKMSNVAINLPKNPGFAQGDLGDGRAVEINQVER
ncbi:acetolactate decarboxylase [Nostoc sp. CMAA1605]|uniref:acetolactate decarboxylase n=1 Tax=Nostoc sp. CMAA1605 TaxID=2055159 RepID=UPI001F3A93E8|nr:acetolactate decarboxylase [Nostoc sp. CMAA1605]MCF4967826.1 acetolactate decarboxylase [Nostoc sp. CMAA1605]